MHEKATSILFYIHRKAIMFDFPLHKAIRISPVRYPRTGYNYLSDLKRKKETSSKNYSHHLRISFAFSMMIVLISSGVLSSVEITRSAFSGPFVLSMP